MSEPTTVDGTTVDELTGKLVLVIEEDRPWRETDVMHRQLSAKVKHYVRYIKSKEFAEKHGQRPEDTIVRLVSTQPPGEGSLRFLEHVGYELAKHGIDFEHQLGEEGIPVALTPGTATLPADPSAGFPITGPPPAVPAPPPAEKGAEAAAARAEAAPQAEPEIVETVEHAAPSDSIPSFAPPTEGEAAGDETLADEPSELELLIEGGVEEFDLIEDETAAETAAAAEPPGPPLTEKPSRPRFFPEEEFGRAVPDMDEVEAILGPAAAEPAVIETSSGKLIRLDTAAAEEAPAAMAGARPSLARAIGAALVAALVGAGVWSVLAVAAGHGASPVALAIALMVGISVRLRGNGHGPAFRVVGIGGTLVGSLLGAVVVAAALSAWQDGLGIAGLLANVTDPSAVWAAINRQYQPLDLASLALALYLAFKISASKPSS